MRFENLSHQNKNSKNMKLPKISRNLEETLFKNLFNSFT